MMTVSQVANRFGLSRSTLLYYDRIGLLSPSERSSANYRLYSEDDVARMELIRTYRRTGLALADIARILSPGESSLTELLRERLKDLDGQIKALRAQQRRVVDLLQGHVSLSETRSLDKDGWVALLRASGLDDEDMMRWHIEFERLAPEAHQDFLESLGLCEPEIERIRESSRV
ncbi:MAG: MerR family transcriptional regulator [Thermoanaerobaculia bacterium]